MGEEYHLIGEPIDTDNWPMVFELRLRDCLPCIDPETFGLPTNTLAIDPYAYFITSGDALAKAIKLEKDIWALASELQKKYARLKKRKGQTTWVFNPKYRKYIATTWKCAGRCRTMVNRLYEAKGINCFLETEWREQRLIVIPKNPRTKPNIIHAE